jgi:hypothetical protein
MRNPHKRLNSVDFPTFGRPRIATEGISAKCNQFGIIGKNEHGVLGNDGRQKDGVTNIEVTK